jgi:predicted site-specific integrase-resolvase
MNYRMMNIREVRDVLGLSYDEVIRLVRNGSLRSYRYVGGNPVTKSDVGFDTKGLRFRSEDVEELLKASLVK